MQRASVTCTTSRQVATHAHLLATGTQQQVSSITLLQELDQAGQITDISSRSNQVLHLSYITAGKGYCGMGFGAMK